MLQWILGLCKKQQQQQQVEEEEGKKSDTKWGVAFNSLFSSTFLTAVSNALLADY